MSHVQATDLLSVQTTDLSSLQKDLLSAQTTDLLSAQTTDLLSVMTPDLLSVQTADLLSARTTDLSDKLFRASPCRAEIFRAVPRPILSVSGFSVPCHASMVRACLPVPCQSIPGSLSASIVKTPHAQARQMNRASDLANREELQGA